VIANNASGGVAVDNSTGKVYYGSFGGQIRSVNLGGGANTVVSNTGSSIVWNMAVDSSKIYFNSSGNTPSVSGVGRVNVDGSGLTRIGNGVSGEALAFDSDNQRVYFQTFESSSGYPIKSVAATGGAITTNPGQPLANQFVPGLFVDEVNDKLYYAHSSGIYRSNLDGTGSVLVANPSSGGFEYSIFVDALQNTIYYGVRGTGEIGRINLDGSNKQTLFFTSSNFYALTLYESETVPEPASLAIWGGLGIAGLVAARRRKKVTG
jgi:hypothetical protein